MKRAPKFEVYTSTELHSEVDFFKFVKPHWRWRLKGANGEIVAQGEAYTRRADCTRAIAAVRQLAGDAEVAILK